MELRGAGDLLGAEQSGSVSQVGFDMFVHMLEQAVASGDLSRSGMRTASQTFASTTSDGLYSQYTYGAVASRNPPRSSTIFRVNPAALIGLEVGKLGVSVPAAQSYVFVKR